MDKLAERNQYYLALLGDIRRSRSRFPRIRERAQSEFLDIIEDVNARHRSKLAVPFSVSRGDEFQGLLSRPDSALEIIDAFDARTDLFSFRYGLGWGEVGTAFRPRTTEMDGSCFLNAYGALERCKTENRWVAFEGAPVEREHVVNAGFRSIQVIRDGWTTKQKTAVNMRRGRDTMSATAVAMGIDKSTLSKMLKAAHYEQLLEMEGAVRILLREYLDPSISDGRP